MLGTCKLFDTEEELRESHIFPKFVIDYLKDTGSKYLRTFVNPNLRLQDGPKKYLFSEKAEQTFSIREKWFSEVIFRPYIEGGIKSFNYDENLFYFTISILWRALLLHLDHPKIVTQPFISTLHEVAGEWKAFLRDYIYPTNFDRCYLFFTDRIKSHNIDSPGVDYYMSRALDATIVSNENQTFLAVYMKFARFVFWGVLKGGDESKLGDMKINPINGQLTIPQKFEEPIMSGFFVTRIKEIETLPHPSEKQKKKITEEFLKNKEEFLRSDAGQSIINDKLNLDPK